MNTLTPARKAAIAEAIACADCALNNAALPQYGELLAALRLANEALVDAPRTAAVRLAGLKIRAALAAQVAA
jgi:hypothetical protein